MAWLSMLPYLELTFLKYAHILCAVVWLGGDVFISFFIFPAAERLTLEARGGLTVNLLPRIFRWFPLIGLATVISGVTLVGEMGLLSLDVMRTRLGGYILAGGSAGIAAMLNANLNFERKGKQLVAIIKTVNATANTRPTLATPELARLFARVRNGIRMNFLLLLFALLMMTMAGLAV